MNPINYYANIVYIKKIYKRFNNKCQNINQFIITLLLHISSLPKINRYIQTLFRNLSRAIIFSIVYFDPWLFLIKPTTLTRSHRDTD